MQKRPSFTPYFAESGSDFSLVEPRVLQKRVLPLAVVLLSLLVFAVAVPYAKTRLPVVPGFIPVYESALIVNDLITSVLLFGQCVIVRSRALAALACGYLYTAAMALLHMLSFPGLFSPTGLLNAGPQSTAWIYMFWHAGFPLFVLAYAIFKDSARDTMSGAAVGAPRLLLVVAAVLCAALAMTTLATAGSGWLPSIMHGNGYSRQMLGVAGTTWGLCLIALAVLWRRRGSSTIDRWLMVVLCVWICDVALSAVFNAARFDLGFYVGRLYGLLAASFVLLLLLVENSFLHSRLAAALEELKRLATVDPLTGAANRRAFEAACTVRWARAAHERAPISLLMLDIDHFKAFNDRYGHVEGDRCLARVAECLMKTAREGHDLVARYGGEEFAILLPQTDAAASVHIAQRICDAVAALKIPHAGSAAASHVTISVGVATCVAEAHESFEALIKSADQALYAAKAAGRGRTRQAALAKVPAH